MKIYICVDMEGIGGVVRPVQVQPGTAEYEVARRWAAQEVLAVIAGARKAGATEFWVKDAHAHAVNLPWDAFPEDVRLISGRTRPVRFPGMDSSFAALFLVGYHAMEGTPDAVLDHTWDYDTRFFLNGAEAGEIAVDAMIAGAYGIPVALVTGDDKTAHEARALLGEVETVIVKEAVTAQGAVLLPQQAVLKRLREGAERTVTRLRSAAATGFLPYRPAMPIHFRMEWKDTAGTDHMKEAEGIDPRAVLREVLGQS